MSKILTLVLGEGLSPMWSNGDLVFGEGIAVTRCAGTPADILAHSQRLAPCVLVVDYTFVEKLNLEDFYNAVDFGLSVRVLVELDRKRLDQAEHLIRIGCAGYLLKGSKPSEAYSAVRAVAAGQLWAGRKIVSNVLLNVLRESKHRLTFRESEILGLLSNGLTNSEIGKRLFISPQTVRWHLRSLYSKLGTHDRSRAVMHGTDIERLPSRKLPHKEGAGPVACGMARKAPDVFPNAAS